MINAQFKLDVYNIVILILSLIIISFYLIFLKKKFNISLSKLEETLNKDFEKNFDQVLRTFSPLQTGFQQEYSNMKQFNSKYSNETSIQLSNLQQCATNQNDIQLKLEKMMIQQTSIIEKMNLDSILTEYHKKLILCLDRFNIHLKSSDLFDFLHSIELNVHLTLKDLQNEYLTFISKMHSLSILVINFLYAQENHKEFDEKLILNQQDQLEIYVNLIIYLPQFNDPLITPEILKILIIKNQDLEIDKITQEFLKVKSYLKELGELFDVFIIFFNDFQKEHIYKEFFDLDFNLSRFAIFDSSLIIVIENILSQYNLSNENFMFLLKFYIYRVHFLEMNTNFIANIDLDYNQIILIYIILQEPNFEGFLKKCVQKLPDFDDLVFKFKSKNETTILKVFYEELKQGKIILDYKELWRIYAHDLNSRLGTMDQLIAMHGGIDYRGVMNKIIQKKWTHSSLLRTLASQQKVKPFLLTFGGGIKDYIEKVNKKFGKKLHPYTNSARIGVIPSGYNSLKDYCDAFLQEFESQYVSMSNDNFKKFFEYIEKLFKDENEKWKSDELRGEFYILIMDFVDKIRYDLEHRDPTNQIYIKFHNFLEENIKNLPPKIVSLGSDIVKDHKILFHELSSDEKGFASTESGNDTNTYDLIRELIEEELPASVKCSGIFFSDFESNQYSTTLKELISDFFKLASFYDLLETNPIFISKPNKTIISNRNIIFGKESTVEYLSGKNVENIEQLGSLFKINLKIDTGIDAKLYDKNIDALHVFYGANCNELTAFWNKKLENLRKTNKKQEVQQDLNDISSNLANFSYYFLETILYFSLVINWELEAYDFPTSAPEVQQIYQQVISSNQEISGEILKSFEINSIIQELVKFCYQQKQSPLYKDFTLGKFNNFVDDDLEIVFKNKFFSNFSYRFGNDFTQREPEISSGQPDFRIHNYPIECKIRKSDDSSDTQDKFEKKHIQQIKDYCNIFQKKVGFLVYYDNYESKHNDFLIENCLYFSRFIKETNGSNLIIITCRIPNYSIKPSDHTKIKHKNKIK